MKEICEALPLTPASFSSAPSGPAVIALYDRGRPIYITAAALAKRWLENFVDSLADTSSGLRYHVARNLERITFSVESFESCEEARRQANFCVALFLPWFNFPRVLRELAGYPVRPPKERGLMFNWASEHCLTATTRLLKCLLEQAGEPLNLRKLFRASSCYVMEEFVAAWDELVREGLVEGGSGDK